MRTTAESVVADAVLTAWAAAASTGEPADLEAALGAALSTGSPMDRYLTAGLDLAVAEAEVARCADERARALADLHGEGWSYARIAEATGLSRARAQQLVERGRLS